MPKMTMRRLAAEFRSELQKSASSPIRLRLRCSPRIASPHSEITVVAQIFGPIAELESITPVIELAGSPDSGKRPLKKYGRDEDGAVYKIVIRASDLPRGRPSRIELCLSASEDPIAMTIVSVFDESVLLAAKDKIRKILIEPLERPAGRDPRHWWQKVLADLNQ